MPTLLFNSSNFLNMSGLSTADNGLQVLPAGNVELGGAMTKNTVVNPGLFTLQFGNLTITPTGVKVATTPVAPTDIVRLQDVIPIVAVAKQTINNFNAAVIAYTPPAAAMYRISMAGVVNAIAGGHLILNLTFHDQSGNIQTLDLANLTTLTASIVPPVTFYAGTGGPISMLAQATADCTAHIVGVLEFLD